MSSVNDAMAQGMAVGRLDRLSLSPAKQFPTNFDTDVSFRRLDRFSMDKLDLSTRARCCNTTGPIDVPLPDDPGGGSDLATSVRKVNQFLEQHPRIAASPFGQSVQTLMRGAVHLLKPGDADIADSPAPRAEKNLLEAARKVKLFLEDHPRIANSPFGKAVSEMARTIVEFITGGTDDTASALRDKVTGAAKQAQTFLSEHPKIAAMPLGQAVEKLMGGVREMGDGNSIDPDIQTLAKRISHFVGNHPRLAESEFGQLAASLARGILALDTNIPPVETPFVADDHCPGDGAGGVSTAISASYMSTTMISVEADLQKAA